MFEFRYANEHFKVQANNFISGTIIQSPIREINGEKIYSTFAWPLKWGDNTAPAILQ